jgi:hypothetical protein
MQIYCVLLIPVKLSSSCQVFSARGLRENIYHGHKDQPLALIME